MALTCVRLRPLSTSLQPLAKAQPWICSEYGLEFTKPAGCEGHVLGLGLMYAQVAQA